MAQDDRRTQLNRMREATATPGTGASEDDTETMFEPGSSMKALFIKEKAAITQLSIKDLEALLYAPTTIDDIDLFLYRVPLSAQTATGTLDHVKDTISTEYRPAAALFEYSTDVNWDVDADEGEHGHGVAVLTDKMSNTTVRWTMSKYNVYLLALLMGIRFAIKGTDAELVSNKFMDCAKNFKAIILGAKDEDIRNAGVQVKNLIPTLKPKCPFRFAVWLKVLEAGTTRPGFLRFGALIQIPFTGATAFGLLNQISVLEKFNIVDFFHLVSLSTSCSNEFWTFIGILREINTYCTKANTGGEIWLPPKLAQYVTLALKGDSSCALKRFPLMSSILIAGSPDAKKDGGTNIQLTGLSSTTATTGIKIARSLPLLKFMNNPENIATDRQIVEIQGRLDDAVENSEGPRVYMSDIANSVDEILWRQVVNSAAMKLVYAGAKRHPVCDVARQVSAILMGLHLTDAEALLLEKLTGVSGGRIERQIAEEIVLAPSDPADNAYDPYDADVLEAHALQPRMPRQQQPANDRPTRPGDPQVYLPAELGRANQQRARGRGKLSRASQRAPGRLNMNPAPSAMVMGQGDYYEDVQDLEQAFVYEKGADTIDQSAWGTPAGSDSDSVGDDSSQSENHAINIM